MQEYVPEIPKEFRERLKNGNLWIMENAKEKVILPMTVLKRFDDILAPTKEAVVKKAEECSFVFSVLMIITSKIAGG